MKPLRNLSLVLLLLSGIGCNDRHDGPDYPDRNGDRVTIKTGLWGDVWFWSGDFMPIEYGGTIQPVSRQMRIYEPTSFEDVDRDESGPFFTNVRTRLVTTVQSDRRGFFQVTLPPGDYSVFAVEGDRLYANGFDGQGNIYPVHVEDGKVSEVRFDITYEATY